VTNITHCINSTFIFSIPIQQHVSDWCAIARGFIQTSGNQTSDFQLASQLANHYSLHYVGSTKESRSYTVCLLLYIKFSQNFFVRLSQKTMPDIIRCYVFNRSFRRQRSCPAAEQGLLLLPRHRVWAYQGYILRRQRCTEIRVARGSCRNQMCLFIDMSLVIKW